jgi:hypothetical protein
MGINLINNISIIIRILFVVTLFQHHATVWFAIRGSCCHACSDTFQVVRANDEGVHGTSKHARTILEEGTHLDISR